MAHKKLGLPAKTCAFCQRPFAWRKKWERDWGTVKFCSDQCRAKSKKSAASERHVPMLPERRIRCAAIDLLNSRPAGATICPSEIARALIDDVDPNAASEIWRDAMPMVHSMIDHMVADGLVQLSWKGVSLAARSGPYRISKVPS